MGNDISKLYLTQVSFTQWLEAIGHKDTEGMRREDNEKRERLGVINKVTGLPYDKPTQFEARDIGVTKEFAHFLQGHGDELCALRLIPKFPNLPTLRMRGRSVRDVLPWFKEQHIDTEKYRADFVPHPSQDGYGMIFVVNKEGIFGEIIKGGHNQLTQGFHHGHSPITFSFDFNILRMEKEDAGAEKELRDAFAYLHITSEAHQEKLHDLLQATFTHVYLCGYFEATSSEHGIWFVDYNRMLGEMFKEFRITAKQQSGALHGQTGSPGKAKGTVRIVAQEAVSTAVLKENDVLVCAMTSPAYIPLMKRACAIITDQGGILSHAAIIARELKKPCIVGTKDATTLLKDGNVVELDADQGTIKIIG